MFLRLFFTGWMISIGNELTKEELKNQHISKHRGHTALRRNTYNMHS